MAEVMLENVTKKFGSVIAVDNISLNVKDGEFLVLLGPSGCGKTTTLRLIAGLEELSSGTIYIGNRVVNEVAPKDRNIAMVFQSYALYPHMNVYQNISFGLTMRKVPKDVIDKKVKEVAGMLGLENLLTRKPKELSGGQRQRVALARAIVRDPQVFLMDEPLSNLDAKLRVQTRGELIRLHERLGVTTVYVTHDQTEAMTLGDRVVVMNKGLIQQIGTPKDVFDKPVNKFVAGFIGTPPMNFIDTEVSQEGGELYLKNKDISVKLMKDQAQKIEEAKLGNKSVLLGVRAKDFYLPKEIEGLDKSVMQKLDITIDFVELMGSETFVHFRVNDSLCVARMSANEDYKMGQKVTLFVDISKINIFDKDTEKAIL
ncbi:MAG: ABC transporter ATP-binding protein [Caldisericaceae bacterium]